MCRCQGCNYKVIVERFALVPKRMINLYGFDSPHNLSEFLLHEICDADLFNIKRAAFLVDNPDFNEIRGIAGYSKEETYKNRTKHWEEPESFSLHMQTAPYNQKVKSFCGCESIKRNSGDYARFLDKYAKALDFNYPTISTWDLKHYNHGIFLYELDGKYEHNLKENLDNFLHMLAFCPLL